ncbi:MAG TPA: hydrogenase small subunit, partial [Polyangiaceae bacterium]
MTGSRGTIAASLTRAHVPRRAFLEFCTKLMVAAPFGLTLTDRVHAAEVAAEIKKAPRPSVIWLHFQDCTGCTESLLRTSQPDVGALIFDLISLDYHETLMAASGADAERVLKEAVAGNDGKFVLVVEGSIPEGHAGEYMTLAGRPAIEVLRDVGQHAAAVIAIGSCASFGGIPAAEPNPTGATGVDSILKGKPIVNIPGCPPNPYTFLATVLEYAAYGKLPALDDKRRPKFAFDETIHDHCPRRAHFDAGRFAETFGDEGHRKGHCLYKLGCKGPDTHAACSTRHFNEVVDAWPIGIGAPCVGCTEQHLAFRKPMFELVQIHRATPPETYPPIHAPQGAIDPLAA